MAEKKAVKSFLLGAAAGAITGAVTALLFAPKKGSELRKDIADTAGAARDKTVELSRKAGSTAQNLVKRSGDWAVDIRSKLARKDKAEAGEQSNASEAAETVQDQTAAR